MPPDSFIRQLQLAVSTVLSISSNVLISVGLLVAVICSKSQQKAFESFPSLQFVTTGFWPLSTPRTVMPAHCRKLCCPFEETKLLLTLHADDVVRCSRPCHI